MEKSTASSYAYEAEINKQNTEKELQAVLKNIELRFPIDVPLQNLKFRALDLPNSLDAEPTFPKSQIWEARKETEMLKTEVEKLKKSPQFSVGYMNNGMYGVGADEKFYDHSKRFHSFLLGVSIPLFTKSINAGIEAQKINADITDTQMALEKRSWEEQKNSLLSQIEQQNYAVEKYRLMKEKDAQVILNTADRLFREGEINYLEWSILLRQALDIHKKALDNLKQLNDRIISYHQLLGISSLNYFLP